MQCACVEFYCHLFSVWLYYIFSSHYLINGTTFGKKLLRTKCEFWFSPQLWSEPFLTLRRIETHMTISIQMCSLYVQVTVHRDTFRKNNQLDTSVYKIYFCHKTLHVSASSVPIIRGYSLFTWQLVRFMQVMWPLPSRVMLELRSNLTLLGSGHITCMKRTNCHVQSG